MEVELQCGGRRGVLFSVCQETEVSGQSSITSDKPGLSFILQTVGMHSSYDVIFLITTHSVFIH